MIAGARLLPQTLIGRVFLLYSLSMLLIAGAGMAWWAQRSYEDSLSGAQDTAVKPPSVDHAAPGVQVRAITEKLPPISHAISVGGKHYGELQLTFAVDRIAAGFWREMLTAVAVALAALMASMLAVRWPLQHWLGSLDHIRAFGKQMQASSRPLKTSSTTSCRHARWPCSPCAVCLKTLPAMRHRWWWARTRRPTSRPCSSW